jgi:hypothetical protein
VRWLLLCACSSAPLPPQQPRIISPGVAPVGWINPRPALLCEVGRLEYAYPNWRCL